MIYMGRRVRWGGRGEDLRRRERKKRDGGGRGNGRVFGARSGKSPQTRGNKTDPALLTP